MRKTFVIALFLIVLSLKASPTEVTGEAVVRSIGASRVAVFLDTNGDHSIDQGFLLTMDIPMHRGYNAHFVQAKVEYTDSYVRVTSDKKLVDLQVAGYPDPPAAPKDADVVTLIGASLMHSNGDSGCDIDRAQNRDAEACYAYGKE